MRWKEKIQWQCYPRASERLKSMCYVPPSHFGQGKIIYANLLPWYIAVLGKQWICCSNSGLAHFHFLWLSDFIFYPKPLYKSLHQSLFYSFKTILPSESGVTLHYSRTNRLIVRPGRDILYFRLIFHSNANAIYLSLKS
jgi:hypothetical protein